MVWNDSWQLPLIPSQPCQPTVLGAPSPELIGWLNTIVQECLKRVRGWQAPPNWARADWLKEAEAQGRVAALEALGQYDASRGVPPAGFTMSRIMARVLTRYRQEWAFASRCVELPESGNMHESRMSSFPIGPGADALEYEELRSALARLDGLDRWMLQRMFWEGQPQRKIAREMGMSQPAVCKRKRLVLDKLRRLLCFPKSSRPSPINEMRNGYQTGLRLQ